MAFENRPDATATISVDEPVELEPARDESVYEWGFETYEEVDHPAEAIYSQGFEGLNATNPDGWTVVGAPAQPTSAPFAGGGHTGAYYMNVPYPGTPVTRTMTGLEVGRSYTLSAWMKPGNAGANVSVGITGIGSAAPVAAPMNVWTNLTYTFTATATAHEARLERDSDDYGTFWDDISLTRNAWTEVVNDGKDGGYVPRGVTNERAHTGTYSARVHWEKNFSVVPGHEYTVAGWVYATTARTVQTGLFDPNDQVIPVKSASIPANTWTRISGTFTAPPSGTATARVSGISTGSFIDDVQLIHHVPPVTTLTPELLISDGEVTVDSGVAPYCLANVSVPLVDEALLEQLDPYADQRVSIQASANGHFELVESEPVWVPEDTRTFDLVMTGRRVSHDGKSIEMELASDEAILQYWSSVTDDTTPRTHEGSLRALVNYVLNKAIPGAVLEAGTTDANLTAYWNARNMILDPGTASTAGGGYTAGACTVDFNDTSWSISYDGDCYNLYNPTSSDSFLGVGNAGTIVFGMRGGRTYVFSATGNVKQTLSGTAHGRARRLVVFYRVGNVAYTEVMSPQVPNTVGAATRVAVEFTLPEGVTEVFLRAYHGYTAGQIRWDGFRLSEKGPGTLADNAVFFDGDTPDTANYTYSWEGAQDLSPSNRVATVERLPELFTWKAGVTAWEFLQPLLTAAGLRLWCDEQRRWRLTDPLEYSLPGRFVAQVSNTTEGTDTMDLQSSLYATGVVIRYRWLDENGTTQERIDAAGTGPFVKTFEVDRPYPGPGAAAARLLKLSGQGRTQDVTVGSDFTVTPGMEIGISLPGTADQVGSLQSVRWRLTEGVMDLGSRGLTEVTPGSWLEGYGDRTWSQAPDTDTWGSLT